MSEDQNNGPKPSGPQGDPNASNFNWKGLVLLALALVLIGSALLFPREERGSETIAYPVFLQRLEEGKIVLEDNRKPLEAVRDLSTGEESLRGHYIDGSGLQSAQGLPVDKFRATVDLDLEYKNLMERLQAKKPAFALQYKYDNVPFAGGILFHLLPVVIVLVVIFLIFRQQMKMAGRGAMSFGKSRAKLLAQDKNRVTFKDVAGVEEAKEEVWELVDFLRDPKKFQRLGGMIPKGVLMVGPPGTGKTLLAKAIAGEADVPFFSISGSDFVEMFVGVGASRVRDMFEQGKKNAPCLIFIDEIDAVGRHRGHGMGGGHDEREQTLNQLLVEMDGFDTQEGVIIIAATNRPDVLDPALLRPGRFDRQVTVNLPDVKGREQILRVHARKVKMVEGTDLGILARGTPGCSGAELANIINEAALFAARKGLKAIGLAELEEARDKVLWGRERRSMAMNEREKEGTAWHEAGHAAISVLLPKLDPLHKVTIIPRGRALGVTMSLPAEDKLNYYQKKSLDELVMLVAGRIAESFFTDDVSSGASSDIRHATWLARHMVCSWGMSEKLGMVEYGETDGPVFLARDMGRTRNYSEVTAQTIDAEIKRIIDEAYERATRLLTENRAKVEAIAKALLEFETLDGDHIREIMETGELKNPPKISQPPDLPPPDGEPARPADSRRNPEDNSGDLPPAYAGAPA
jgi:cell division protease FtsH